jgi:hypothetical protein
MSTEEEKIKAGLATAETTVKADLAQVKSLWARAGSPMRSASAGRSWAFSFEGTCDAQHQCRARDDLA